MERQNIDEASSRARQDEIALFLSASLARSGQKAAGDVFNKYVKLRRLDVATRSALPVVNSYGLGGNRFGFNVTSRLTATGDATRHPRATLFLEKQNFPILVVLGLSTGDIRPRVVRVGSHDEIWEPKMKFVQTHRWSRQVKRGVFHEGLRSVFLPGFPGRPMNAPSNIYDILLGVETKKAELDYYYPNNEERMGRVYNKYRLLTDVHYDFLHEQRAAVSVIDIPVEYLVGKQKEAKPKEEKPKDAPAIFDVYPTEMKLAPVANAEGTLDHYESKVVFVGRGLEQIERTAEKIHLPEGIEVQVLRSLPGLDDKQVVALNLSMKRPIGAFQVRFQLKEQETKKVTTKKTTTKTVTATTPDGKTATSSETASTTKTETETAGGAEEDKPAAEPVYLYSPILYAEACAPPPSPEPKLTSVLPPIISIAKEQLAKSAEENMNVTTVELYVQGKGLSEVALNKGTIDLKVTPEPGEKAIRAHGQVSRVVPHDTDANLFIVDIVLHVNQGVTGGELTFVLPPKALPSADGAPVRPELRSAPIKLNIEKK